MPIIQFNQNPQNPTKLVPDDGRGHLVFLQVLDASTLFIGTARDPMALTSGAAGTQQGLQIIQTDRIVQLDWKGEMWAVNTTPAALIDIEILDIDRDVGGLGTWIKRILQMMGLGSSRSSGGDGAGCRQC